MENLLVLFLRPVICKDNPYILCKKGQLPQPLLQNIKIKNRFFKDLLIRQKAYRGSGFIQWTVPDHLQRVNRLSSFISLPVNLSLMVNRYFQPL